MTSRRSAAAAALLAAALAAAVASSGPADARPAGVSTGGVGIRSAAVVGCPLLPADNIWHHRVDTLPLVRGSATFVASIGTAAHLHPDFGSGLIEGAPFGFPITTVPADQPLVPVSFTYAAESDRGPYPIPPTARVEGGAAATGDRHVLVYRPSSCTLYELFDAHRLAGGGWRAGSGAVYDLRSNRLRPRGWTSADAAGLPILPGLVRYEEVSKGVLRHAIRMTVPQTKKAFLWPARHFASTSTNAALPPMGLRLRMKSSVSLAGLGPQARVVAQAMKTYGLIVADNGSPWFFSGTQDGRWDNDDLNGLKRFTGADFEAVDESGLMIDPSSGAARP
jgi:hypothetical protein